MKSGYPLVFNSESSASPECTQALALFFPTMLFYRNFYAKWLYWAPLNHFISCQSILHRDFQRLSNPPHLSLNSKFRFLCQFRTKSLESSTESWPITPSQSTLIVDSMRFSSLLHRSSPRDTSPRKWSRDSRLLLNPSHPGEVNDLIVTYYSYNASISIVLFIL
jgi:hypothetical protein